MKKRIKNLFSFIIQLILNILILTWLLECVSWVVVVIALGVPFLWIEYLYRKNKITFTPTDID